MRENLFNSTATIWDYWFLKNNGLNTPTASKIIEIAYEK